MYVTHIMVMVTTFFLNQQFIIQDAKVVYDNYFVAIVY